MTETVDFLIIGGGIVGLALALQARWRFPKAKIVLLEKEKHCGQHASGRNSGVLHAGFYYASDSLKARFTREGNRMWQEYCSERNLPINRCGKLVVAQSQDDLSGLETLYQRGQANGVDLEWLSEKEAQKIEPRVKTYEKALFSPTTASVDPLAILSFLKKEVQGNGVDLRLGVAYKGRDGENVLTSDGKLSAGYVINASGLYADRVAREFGFSKEYVIVPFKGLYLYSDEPAGSLKTHIYPVPSLNQPFLGVHYTLTVKGEIKIGPTAIPAFWREHYSGMKGFRLNEFLDIIWREMGLFWRNDFGFRSLALAEIKKYNSETLSKMAETLVKPTKDKTIWRWGKAGIRAQLMHKSQHKLMMDFYCEGDHKSFHVLNAVSPGFTCAFPFSAHLWDLIEKKQV